MVVVDASMAYGPYLDVPWSSLGASKAALRESHAHAE